MKYNSKLFPFSSNWIKINGETIHYVDEGKGPIILFSHAPLGSSFMYRKFIKRLSKNYRCIALDYPGFGLSSNHIDKKYSIKSQSTILKCFIEGKQLSNIIAFGHDTGGPTILQVALQNPELFSALILTDTLIYPTTEYPRIHRMLGLLEHTLVGFLNQHTNFIAKLTFNIGVRSRKLDVEEKKQYWQLFSTKNRRHRIIELLTSLRKQSVVLHEIKEAFQHQLNSIPTLLIYGEDDPVTKMGIPMRIHKSQRVSELYLIKGEGHFPHEGQPLRMCQIIEQWLDNQLTPDEVRDAERPTSR